MIRELFNPFLKGIWKSLANLHLGMRIDPTFLVTRTPVESTASFPITPMAAFQT